MDWIELTIKSFTNKGVLPEDLTSLAQALKQEMKRRVENDRFCRNCGASLKYQVFKALEIE